MNGFEIHTNTWVLQNLLETIDNPDPSEWTIQIRTESSLGI